MEILYTEFYNKFNMLYPGIQIFLIIASVCFPVISMLLIGELVNRINRRVKFSKLYGILLLSLGFLAASCCTIVFFCKEYQESSGYIEYREVIFTDDKVDLSFFEDWYVKEKRGKTWIIEPNDKITEES